MGLGGLLGDDQFLADLGVRQPAESCDSLGTTCDDNQEQFKGVFMRNLGELNNLVGGAYTPFIDTQISSLWNNDRDTLNDIGERWSGQSSSTNPTVSDWRTQASALEALLSAP